MRKSSSKTVRNGFSSRGAPPASGKKQNPSAVLGRRKRKKKQGFG